MHPKGKSPDLGCKHIDGVALHPPHQPRKADRDHQKNDSATEAPLIRLRIQGF